MPSAQWQRLSIWLVLSAILLTGSAQSDTLTVCNSGCEYTTIQAAVNAANPEDTIEVQSGTYDENVVVDERRIEIKGKDTGSGRPIVDGKKSGSPVTLSDSADESTVEGLDVRNSGTDDAGIRVRSDNNIISSNIATENADGIRLEDQSGGNLIRDNVADDNTRYGIHLQDSQENDVSRNSVKRNADGIRLRSTGMEKRCERNLVRDNVASGNSGSGIHLQSCQANDVSKNIVEKNHDGIITEGASGNSILDNIVTSNANYGAYISRSAGNIIRGNLLEGNSYGIFPYESTDNIIFLNKLISNAHNGEQYPEESNQWSSPLTAW